MENEAYKTCLRCLPAQVTTAVEECDATKFNQVFGLVPKKCPP